MGAIALFHLDLHTDILDSCSTVGKNNVTRFVFSQARSVSFKEMYALAVCINEIQVHLFVSLTTNLNRKHGDNRNRSFPEDIGKFLIDVDKCRQSVGRKMTDDYFFRRLTESYQYFYEIITLLL